MASNVSLHDLEDFIREKIVEEGWTHCRLSLYLKRMYPGIRGFSVRSIERFCSDKDIHRTSRMDGYNLQQVVSEAVRTVGPAYGRKTMTGYLRSQGVRISETRVGQALSLANPIYHHNRREATTRSMNPIPYSADYFGHKVHIDQNEKLVLYGVTHICAIDGYSNKIVAFITMPIKNCIEIYSHLYKPMLSQYGLWDQIRVDHGKEWQLMLFVQEKLAHLRYNTQRAPHLQTTSKLNHPVERIWVEINSRVNYPIKACLIDMEERGLLSMDDAMIKYCVSWFAIRVANVGTKIAVDSWNQHTLRGHRNGTPNEVMRRVNMVAVLDPFVIPEVNDAVRELESLGSRLTHFSGFGIDPFQGQPDLVEERERLFKQRYPDFGTFFHTVVNNDFNLFQQGLLFFIEKTRDLM